MTGTSVCSQILRYVELYCRYFTRPDVPPVAYPEGFQGNSIPIDGALVAELVHERLTLSEEADD